MPEGLAPAAARRGPGAGAAVAGVGAVSGYAAERLAAPPAAPGADVVAFRGEHQAGIVTPAQDRLHFVAFDLTTTDRGRGPDAAAGVDHGRRADDGRARAPPDGAVDAQPGGAAGRHRRGARAARRRR